MSNIRLHRENEILRKRVKDLELQLEELLFDVFYGCIQVESKKYGITKNDGWYLPTISNEEDACFELEQMGKLIKHSKMDWWRIKDLRRLSNENNPY